MTLPSSYQPNIPQAADQLSKSQNDLLLNFQALQALVDVNHVDFAITGAGKHKWVTWPQQTAGVVDVAAATEIINYNATSTLSSRNEIFLRRSAGTDVPTTAKNTGNGGNPVHAFGWTYLPSGILLKWGTIIPTVVTPLTVTLPVAATIPVFASILSIQLSSTTNNGGNPQNAEAALFQLVSMSTTQFVVSTNSSPDNRTGFMYLAIGT